MSAPLLPNRAPVIEYWKSDFHTTEPQTEVVPFLWHYEDLRAQLMEARDTITAMAAERRLLCLSNPGLPGKPYATATLMGDVQLLKPGERAPAHRHTTSSIRLCLEGKGGYTMVDGEKCPMERGDVIVNPIWAWHHHGNEGTEDVIWVDVLDVPLVTALGATIYDYDYKKEGDADEHFITARERDNRSHELFSAGGIVPRFSTAQVKWHNTQVAYKWRDMRAALERMKAYEGDPYDGLIADYVNPASGQSVIPTMALSAQLIRPSDRLKTHRHTSSTIYCVVEGEGYTEIDGKKFAWKPNDLFVVPIWKWHRHVNTAKSTDAVLFAVTDAPVAQSLRLYREEALADNGAPLPVRRDRAPLPDYINRAS